MYKVKGGEAFHLIALKAPVCGIVNLFEIGLVSECRIPGKPHYGSLGTVIPFTCKEHGKEGAAVMDCGVVPARLSLKASAIPCNFMRLIKSSDMVFWSCCPVTGAVLLFISIILALLFLFVFSVIVTSTYILVGQWYRGCHVRLYPPVLIRKEIRVVSQFKHLS